VARYRDHADAAGRRERGVTASAALGRRASGSGAPKRRDSSTANCRPTDAVCASRQVKLVGQPLPALAIGDAEHRPQDHLERHALHVRMHGNGSRFGHDTTSRATTARTVDSYARMRAVKRRQHEPPAGQVVAPLQQQQ
jgi:hypothetical protein